MPITPTERAALQNAEASVRTKALAVLLERVRGLGVEATDLLAEARDLLAEGSDWAAVFTVAEEAIKRIPEGPALTDWLSCKAFACFWLDRPTDAWEIVTNIRAAAEAEGQTGTRLRLALVSGYVMDVRGAHAKALAWYTQALGFAEAVSRPKVLLEIATSLSKQGELAEALLRFDEARSLLLPGNTQHERLRVHLLSRSAVVQEQLGDFAEALRRHDEALTAARAQDSQQMVFECLCRRARTHLAAREFDAAREDLVVAEELAPLARRGVLHVTHDWARFHRARGEWAAAFARYRACVALIPSATETVGTFSDIWSEILDGLAECYARTGRTGTEVVLQARVDLSAARGLNDIYAGQSVTAAEHRERAAASTERVRAQLLDEVRTTFSSAGYRFDLRAGTATSMAEPPRVLHLDDGQREILACLLAAPTRSAGHSELRDHLKKTTGFAPTPEAIRQMVARLRGRLGLGEQALFRGRRGVRGGGYELAVGKE